MARSYVYQISRRRTAFAKPFVWWVREDLEAGGHAGATAVFVGLKDFRSFTADDRDETSTRVQVDRVEIFEEPPAAHPRRGSHFLWRMVRRLVGVLVRSAAANCAADVAACLTRRRSESAALTAPSSGLFLERVYYPGDGIPGGCHHADTVG